MNKEIRELIESMNEKQLLCILVGNLVIELEDKAGEEKVIELLKSIKREVQ